MLILILGYEFIVVVFPSFFISVFPPVAAAQPPTPPTHASVQAMKIITHWILYLDQLEDKFLEA